MQETCEL